MKEFIKDNLVTVVEDNDRRIPEYLAKGWKEKELTQKRKAASDKRKAEAIADADASEDNGKKNSATDQKVNDAMSAKDNAAAESQAVDDGLIKTDGGKNNG